MTHRDPPPVVPDCPLCESNSNVRQHDKPSQARWLCLADMLLFDGTSGEWMRPKRTEHPDITDELASARAALNGGNDGS